MSLLCPCHLILMYYALWCLINLIFNLNSTINLIKKQLQYQLLGFPITRSPINCHSDITEKSGISAVILERWLENFWRRRILMSFQISLHPLWWLAGKVAGCPAFHVQKLLEFVVHTSFEGRQQFGLMNVWLFRPDEPERVHFVALGSPRKGAGEGP